MVTLTGFDFKFARAFSLVETLEEEISDYLASSPFETTEFIEPESGDLVVTARVSTRPPTFWSILVGDALHNAGTMTVTGTTIGPNPGRGIVNERPFYGTAADVNLMLTLGLRF